LLNEYNTNQLCIRYLYGECMDEFPATRKVTYARLNMADFDVAWFMRICFWHS
jgi:hypothetical protein